MTDMKIEMNNPPAFLKARAAATETEKEGLKKRDVRCWDKEWLERTPMKEEANEKRKTNKKECKNYSYQFHYLIIV